MATTMLAVAAPLQAQQPRNAGEGFWLGAGVGWGSAKVGCGICASGREGAWTGQVRFGGTLSDRLLLGVEGNGWMRNDRELGVRDLMLGVGLSLYWYPSPAGTRYFVKAGVGPMFFRAEDSDVGADDEPDPPLTSTAVGGHFGVGYDVVVGPVSLTPFVNFTGSLYGNLVRESTRLTDVDLTLLQIGLGVIRR